MLKNYYFSSRDERKQLTENFYNMATRAQHAFLLYHWKPIVCFTFASCLQTNRNILAFNNIFNSNCPMRKEKLQNLMA